MASLRRLFNELIVVFLLGLVQPRRLGENIEVLLRRGLVLLHLHEPLDEQLDQLAEIERAGEALPDPVDGRRRSEDEGEPPWMRPGVQVVQAVDVLLFLCPSGRRIVMGVTSRTDQFRPAVASASTHPLE